MKSAHVVVLIIVLLLAACSPSVVGPVTREGIFTPVVGTATPSALVTLIPTDTPAFSSTPIVTPTSASLPPPTDPPPPPTPAPPDMEGQTNEKLGLAWEVPSGWPEVTDHMPAEDDVLYRQVWANFENVPQIISGSASQHQDTLMVLSVRVTNEADSSFPPPGSRQQVTPLDQKVAALTVSGVEAVPFSLRLSYTLARSPYHYTLELGCLFPAEADSAAAEASCRELWRRISWDFGICPLPGRPISLPESWQTVADEYYGYSFQIPSDWYEQEYRSLDQREFVTDPVVLTQPRSCRKPNGFMGLGLSVSPPGNFKPADGPDRTGYTQLPDKPFPIWIRYQDETEVGVEGVTNTAIYIQGSSYWYSLGFQCHAPSGADNEAQAAFQAQCDAIVSHLLDSFRILP